MNQSIDLPLQKVNAILKSTSRPSAPDKVVAQRCEKMYNYNEILDGIIRKRKEQRMRGQVVLHFDSGGNLAKIEDTAIY